MNCVLTSLLEILRCKSLRPPPYLPPKAEKELNAITAGNS